MKVQAWSERFGSTRVEVDAIVHILDAKNGLMHTLLQGNRVMTMPIDAMPAEQGTQDSLEWLQKLRDFQGQAELIDEQRVIQGEDTVGYRLTLDAMAFTLWAVEQDNRPVLLEGTLPGGMTLRSEMVFDQTFTDDLFEVPADALPINQD